jgi:predicted dehydrogenase
MVELAIFGAGAMGTNHLRVAQTLPSARVALVVDVNRARARRIAEPAGARWAVRAPDDLSGIDAAIVAVPTHYHADVAGPLLEAGIPVLVEKPLAGSLADAQALVETAAAKGVVLMVGHVEQFNTAVLELDRLASSAVHLEATRVGPYSRRIQEGVILDLMIHDLEIIRRLVGSSPTDVRAMAQRTRSETEDLACALLCFDGGVTASLTASRVAQNKVRQLEITQARSTISVDLLRQGVTVYKTSRSEYRSQGKVRYRQSGVIEIPFLEQRGEPLRVELDHFVECVLSGKQPRVDGQQGLEALSMALQVAEAAGVDPCTSEPATSPRAPIVRRRASA